MITNSVSNNEENLRLRASTCVPKFVVSARMLVLGIKQDSDFISGQRQRAQC